MFRLGFKSDRLKRRSDIIDCEQSRVRSDVSVSKNVYKTVSQLGVGYQWREVGTSGRILDPLSSQFRVHHVNQSQPFSRF